MPAKIHELISTFSRDFNDYFNAYFTYFWPLYLRLNKELDKKAKYFPQLEKQIRKCVAKQLKFNPELLVNKHFYHTFKKPHTWSLTKWRRVFRKFLRAFFLKNPHLQQHKLVILREFHQCRIECHYVEVWNKREKNETKFIKKQFLFLQRWC